MFVYMSSKLTDSIDLRDGKYRILLFGFQVAYHSVMAAKDFF